MSVDDLRLGRRARALLAAAGLSAAFAGGAWAAPQGMPSAPPAAPPASSAPPAAPPAAASGVPGPGAECPPQAGVPSADRIAAARSRARDRGFLWRIERDGQHSWLYGTLHVARFDWAFPGPQLTAALREARVVALELDLTDPALAPTARAKGAPALELPADLQQRLSRRLAAECLPAGALEALPVILQAATLSALAGRRDGLDPAYAIDAMLAGFGHAAGKRVVALETLERQVEVLQGEGGADALRFVAQTLDELDQGRARAQMRRMAQVWADGDLATLARYPQWCECLDTPADRALMHRLLDRRNAGMAERIDALHRDGGGVFAAVGSLHFIGPQGLPALLAARGYRVERVTFGR